MTEYVYTGRRFGLAIIVVTLNEFISRECAFPAELSRQISQVMYSIYKVFELARLLLCSLSFVLLVSVLYTSRTYYMHIYGVEDEAKVLPLESKTGLLLFISSLYVLCMTFICGLPLFLRRLWKGASEY